MIVQLTTGMQLPQRSVEVDRAALVRYAGASGDFNPIHYSDAAATAVGLPGVIAHGMYTMAVAASVVEDWCGDDATVSGFEVRFSQPVVVPAVGSTTLVIDGTVLEADAASAHVALQVTCEGIKVLGKAVAVVNIATINRS